jgi:hypothetical protein
MGKGLCHVCFSSNVLVTLVEDLPTCDSCIANPSS